MGQSKPRPKLRSKKAVPPLAPPAAATPQRTIPCARPHPSHDRYSLLLIALTAWVAHYLYIGSLGLYSDDWLFAGEPFLRPARVSLGMLWELILQPAAAQGRPLQYAALYLVGLCGALAGSLVVDYLIVWALLTSVGCLLYRVLRHRYGVPESTLTALLFVLTPLHTLHQYLNGQLSFAPAFLCTFGAMLLYLRGRRVWAYLLAPFALVSYESVFFLFFGAPLLRRGRLWRSRRREWVMHMAVCTATAGACFVLRRQIIHESRVTELFSRDTVVWPAVRLWLSFSATSFTTYWEGARRVLAGVPIVAWPWAVLFCSSLVWFFRLHRRPATASRIWAGWLAYLVRPAANGLAFLALGYLISYFFDVSSDGRFPYTDRMTRVSGAGALGSSLFVATLLTGAIRMLRSTAARLAARGVAIAVLASCFLYSFVLQLDYVHDWEAQRHGARQVMALAPDARPGSLIVLRVPFDAPGLPGNPAIGADLNGYDRLFEYIYRDPAAPKLFIVVSEDWPKYLRREADGMMRWSEAYFPGRWYPSTGRYEAGTFIVLEKRRSGEMVRNSAPIFVQGVQIVQAPEAVPAAQQVWRRMPTTPLMDMLLPGFAAGRR